MACKYLKIRRARLPAETDGSALPRFWDRPVCTFGRDPGSFGMGENARQPLIKGRVGYRQSVTLTTQTRRCDGQAQGSDVRNECG